MLQETNILDNSASILSPNQIEALKSLSQLLTREISSLESNPHVVSQQITNGEKISFTEEVRKFEIALIRSALICAKGKQTTAAGILGLKNSTLNEKIKRLKINLNEAV